MNAETTAAYSQMPDWLAEILEPLSAEAKALATRTYDTAFRAAVDHGNCIPDSIALSAMTGIGVQVGLQIIAKGMELRPDVHPIQIGNYIAREVSNSTLITFRQLILDLGQAEAERYAAGRTN